MKLVTATPNALYADTDEPLTPSSCALIKARGFLGVIRYLSGLTKSELGIILASGLPCFFVNFSRAAGWNPSANLGLQDAERDLACLAALSIPTGVHVAFDLEGPSILSGVGALQAHVTAHANAILKSGNFPSLYVGEGALMTSAQLFALPSVLYWASCSKLVDIFGNAQVPACDYSMKQGRPFDVVLTSDDGLTKVTVDFNNVIQDLQGRLPIGVGAS